MITPLQEALQEVHDQIQGLGHEACDLAKMSLDPGLEDVGYSLLCELRALRRRVQALRELLAQASTHLTHPIV